MMTSFFMDSNLFDEIKLNTEVVFVLFYCLKLYNICLILEKLQVFVPEIQMRFSGFTFGY